MNTNAVVSIDELRQNLAALVGQVMYRQDRVLIKKYDKNAAVLLSIEDYEQLVDPAKRLSKDQWDMKFALFDAMKVKTKQSGLESAINAAVKDVRAAKKHAS